ncbi:general substrate transporter [Cryphonectria parasitica EP155]|uniref:General substrate transporter n=1 Tax=Cryphonectria parasitica (strain ATCC 38755 / EP155) TaxID=660469 RepID=A0A9P4XZY3_CRYP1|nr:general substrate transporter [Cryphonectria parasitica EP155]KAF3764006.1 general substrate transporter [Cryphonectria parasitica EP155]
MADLSVQAGTDGHNALDEKPEQEGIERALTTGEDDAGNMKGDRHVMRARADDLGIWETVKRYRLVTLVGMIAAFAATLDGYQINLNAGIVSNKGFIKQMASPGTTIIAGQYISAWGGIQSAGQTIGQIVLQYATDSLGRKAALYILWVFLAGSIFAETFATQWDHWLVAKLFSGAGVGMLQSTMPLYLCELAPTQLRGFLINAYSFWFVIGQLSASIGLNVMNTHDPYEFRKPIYTQWAFIGGMLVIFLLLPESPWWLVSKGKTDRASKTLLQYNGHVPGYDVQEVIGVMTSTIEEERQLAKVQKEDGPWAIFQGRNLIRFVIAGWPKITQQFVGLSVFNTYSTYFFQDAGNKNPFLVTVILSCVQLLSMIGTSTLTDSFGRRPLTVYPYALTSVSLLCLGIVGCFDYTTKALSSLLIFFACLATFSTTGASAIGYAYATEIPQQRLRARTAGWSLAASNAIATMFSFCTPLMINGPVTKWGPKTGFFFAATGGIATVISWFILPEVARRTPAEIDEMFEKRVNFRKFDRYVCDVQIYADEQHRKDEQEHT